MAAPLDRTWYNTLIDDTGDGMSGTVWNKAQVDGLMDTIDASLAGLVPTSGLAGYVDKTGTPVANQVAVFNDGDTVRGTTNLTHDTQTLIATCPIVNTQALVAQKVMTSKSTTSVLAVNAWSPSIQLNGKAGGSWHIGLNDDLAGEFVIGGGYGPGSGFVPSIRITTDGYVVVTNGRILFPNVANASPDVFTLDDYREGTFLPTLTATGGASGQSYVAQNGFFTKVGRIVIVNAYVVLNTAGTFTGNVVFGNLPFTCSVGGGNGGLSIGYWANLNANVVGLTGYVVGGGTTAAIHVILPAGTPNSFGVPLSDRKSVV